MKTGHVKILLLLIVATFQMPFALAADGQPDPALTKKINHILDSRYLREARIGIGVYSLTRKEMLYEHNLNLPLNPASNLKLVTTWTALKNLGPYYRFLTTFYANRGLEKGTITTLYVKGGGDPFLVIERLWRIAGDLYLKGLRVVEGDIMIDGSFFDDDLHTENWPEEPGPQVYFAPTAALAVNFNSVAFYVNPGKKVGDAAEVIIDPNVGSVKYRIEAKTVGSYGKKTIHIARDADPNIDFFHVQGQIPLGHFCQKPQYRNVRHPLNYAGEALKVVLESRGIKVLGQVRLGRVPTSAVEVFIEESPPLGALIQYVNKNSNNFMAEQVLKTMAAETFVKPGRTDQGVKLLGKELQNLGIKPADFHLENGSGLSHENLITAQAFLQVLEAAWANPTLSPEYFSSLALGGYDGTLEDRQQDEIFKTSDKSPRLRAKTGSLKGVSCISGYLTRSDGETLAFSILMNNLRKSFDQENHDIQDKILKVLAD